MKAINGIHLRKSNNQFVVKNKKSYTWIVPEKIESDLKAGDIVLVNCKNTKAPVLVLKIFDFGDKKIKHKKIIKILEKNKKSKYFFILINNLLTIYIKWLIGYFSYKILRSKNIYNFCKSKIYLKN